MATNMVKCRSCQQYYDITQNSSCPHCGGRVFITNPDEKNQRERKEEMLNSHKDARNSIFFERNKRITTIARTALVLAVMALVFLSVSLYKARVNAEINASVRDIEHKIKTHEYVDAYRELDGLRSMYSNKKRSKRFDGLEEKLEENLLEYADECYRNNEYDYAISILKSYYEISNKQLVGDRLTRYLTDQICKGLDEFEMPQDVESALIYLKASMETYGIDETVLSERFGKYLQIYLKESFSEAERYADEGSYEKASSLLENLAAVGYNSDEVQVKLDYFRTMMVQQEVQEKLAAIDDADLAEVINCIDELEKQYDLQDPALEDRKEEYLQEYRKTVAHEAESVYDNEGNLAAADFINKANGKLTNKDATLSGYEQKYRSYKPVYLYNLEPMSSTNYEWYSSETFKTNTGDTYHNAILGRKWLHNGHATYYLGGKYKSIRGIWASRDNGIYCEAQVFFEIYCDDELVYTSPGLSTEDFPVEFDVDISGCQKMEINLPGETGYHMLADVELVQEFSLE